MIEITEWMKSKYKKRNAQFWIPNNNIQFTENLLYSNNRFSVLINENQTDCKYTETNYTSVKRKINTIDNINMKYNYLNNINDNKTRQTIETKKNKEIQMLNSVTKIKQIKLFYLNDKQKKIIRDWITECDKVYNYTIDMYNNKDPMFNLNYTKMNKYILDQLYKDKKIGTI